MPLGKVAGNKTDWMIQVAIYTLAGSMTSVFIGALIGSLGGLLLRPEIGKFGLLAALAAGVIAISRELKWISFPLPQLKRQTKDYWGKIFPGTVAAALWGFDLGLIFTTRLTFSGAWLLAIVTFLIGEPVFGAILFILYWIGRALSIWIGPLLMPDAGATPLLLDKIAGQYQLFQRIHVMGLIWSIFVLTLWLML